MIDRLDELVERTGRSRGFYLRLAIGTMLPRLEDAHWNQVAAQFEDDTIDQQFREIMTLALAGNRNADEQGKSEK
ncbi:hypothetical protein C5L39_10475 [Corynebacterium alimapuense]|uniref:Ribbon-helix-helix protein CopG domain-containing protein n=1 Tax=Corynebacterium alimapuense TaxID=1576874 RepID=A0A3M8K656_9CORY|nr:hypothetical protein C5L39_10475 [Corynebacterium alimapuense]